MALLESETLALAAQDRALAAQDQALAAADQKLTADLAAQASTARAARAAISEKMALLESHSSYLLAQDKMLKAEREALAAWVQATHHIDNPRDNTDK